MSYFKAVMHQIRFRLGLRPRTRWRSSQRTTRLPSWILGVLLLRAGRGGKEGGKGGAKRKGGGEGKGGKGGGTGKGREGGGEDPLDLLPQEKFPSYATDQASA